MLGLELPRWVAVECALDAELCMLREAGLDSHISRGEEVVGRGCIGAIATAATATTVTTAVAAAAATGAAVDAAAGTAIAVVIAVPASFVLTTAFGPTRLNTASLFASLCCFATIAAVLAPC